MKLSILSSFLSTKKRGGNAVGATELKLGEIGITKKSVKGSLEIQNDFQIEFTFTTHVDEEKAIFSRVTLFQDPSTLHFDLN